MSIRDKLQRTPGYQEHQDRTQRLGFKNYPWKTLALNTAGIAAAHGAGYIGAGALTKALERTQLARRLTRLPPSQQRRVLGHIIGAAGSTGIMAHSLASMAGQARLAEEMSRLEKKQEIAQNTGSTKTASVYSVYSEAMREELE